MASNTGFLAGLFSPTLDFENRIDFSRTTNSNVQTTTTTNDARSVQLIFNSPNSSISSKKDFEASTSPSQQGGIVRDTELPVASGGSSSSFDFQTLAILGILGTTAYFIFGGKKK